MSPTRLFILLALALAVTGGAFWLSAQRTLPRDPDYGTPVLPGLAAELDAVSSVRVVGAGDKTLVTLMRAEHGWTVAEVGYPADTARVRRLLVALGDLHIVEPKTREPTRYAALGVEDTGSASAQGVRIDLGGLKDPVSVLVGRRAGSDGTYVRVPGAAQALEARPALDVSHAPRDWLQRTIVDVAPDRVQSVLFERDGEPAWRAQRNARSAAHFDVPDLPRGRELVSAGAADAASGVLGNLEFEEVRPASADAPSRPARPHRATVRTFDGLSLTVEGWTQGEEHWIRVAAASFDPEAAARFPAGQGETAPGAEQTKAETERVLGRTKGWEYRLPAYRFDALFRKRDDVLRH